MTRKYHYKFEWDRGYINDEIYNFKPASVEFDRESVTEFDAVIYAIRWMKKHDIDSFKLIYCRVEEVFDSEMRTNVLLLIEE